MPSSPCGCAPRTRCTRSPGVVGLIAPVVDVRLFNLLRFAGGEGPFYDKPLTAKSSR